MATFPNPRAAYVTASIVRNRERSSCERVAGSIRRFASPYNVTEKRRSGSRMASFGRTSASITLYIVVFNAIASASGTTATVVNPRWRAKVRAASRRSCLEIGIVSTRRRRAAEAATDVNECSFFFVVRHDFPGTIKGTFGNHDVGALGDR